MIFYRGGFLQDHNTAVSVLHSPWMISAPPGNWTRVIRMGILHDTTTPVALQVWCYINIIWNLGQISRLGRKCRSTSTNKSAAIIIPCITEAELGHWRGFSIVISSIISGTPNDPTPRDRKRQRWEDTKLLVRGVVAAATMKRGKVGMICW